MNARLNNQCQNFCRCHVARVNPFIRFAKKYGAAFIRFTIFLVACFCFGALLVSHLAPSVAAIVSATFAFTVAFAALVGQAKRSGLVTQKEVSRCRQNLLAPVTLPGIGGVVCVNVHCPNFNHVPHLGEYP